MREVPEPIPDKMYVLPLHIDLQPFPGFPEYMQNGFTRALALAFKRQHLESSSPKEPLPQALSEPFYYPQVLA